MVAVWWLRVAGLRIAGVYLFGLPVFDNKENRYGHLLN